MKITRDTPDQLIIENNPVWMAVVITLRALIFFAAGVFIFTVEAIAGLAFMFVGLFIGIVLNMVFVRRTQLILDNGQGSVEIRRRSWFGFSKVQWELAHLDKAIVQTSWAKTNQTRSSGPTHRTALVINGGMDPGEHPVTFVHTSGNGADRITTAINTWLSAIDQRPRAS